MNEQNQRDSIMSMARGAFEERVDYEMDKVIQNILDPNTKATAKRKITLTIFHRSTEEVEEAKLERLKNRLDGRNNWQGSSLHKWIEKQFSTGGDGHE